MSGSHLEGNTSQSLDLPALEAHVASLCVAIACGGVGGNVAARIPNELPAWGVVALAGGLGFCVSWVVCKYAFKTAHAWYGSSSWKHRIYDAFGIASAIVALYV